MLRYAAAVRAHAALCYHNASQPEDDCVLVIGANEAAVPGRQEAAPTLDRHGSLLGSM